MPYSRSIRLPLGRFALAGAAAVALSACSEMKFAKTDGADADVYDSRKDIRLSGVVTTTTSGTARLRQVSGDAAVYSEDRGLLKLEKANIEMFREDGSLQGATAAEEAVIYMADQADGKMRKGDLAFAGNFRHRAPAESDPTTDSLIVSTDSIKWDERTQMYHCPSPYRMTNAAPGQPPMVLAGQQFFATGDMKSIKMGGASVSNDPGMDVRAELEPLGREIQQEADAYATRPAKPLPTPLVVDPTRNILPERSMIKRAEEIKKNGTAQ